MRPTVDAFHEARVRAARALLAYCEAREQLAIIAEAEGTVEARELLDAVHNLEVEEFKLVPSQQTQAEVLLERLAAVGI